MSNNKATVLLENGIVQTTSLLDESPQLAPVSVFAGVRGVSCHVTTNADTGATSVKLSKPDRQGYGRSLEGEVRTREDCQRLVNHFDKLIIKLEQCD